MQSSYNMNSTFVQRGVIIVLVGVLLVTAAYVWGNRLSADTKPSPLQASQYRSLQGVAGVRQLDAAQLRDAAAVASIYAGLRGVAAARAADAAVVSAASSSAASQFASFYGVAAARAADAAVVSAASSTGASEFASFHGVAAVRAADAAQSAAGPDSGVRMPKWAGISVPKADGPNSRGGRTI
jgi:hypothetical protein